MRNAAAQYIQEVNKRITCPNSLKRPFLRQLESEAACFYAEHPDADISTLSMQFGAPSEVADEFLSELGEQTLNRYTRTRKRLLHLTIAILLAAIAFVIMIGVRTDFLQKKLLDEDFVASITYATESDGSVWFPFKAAIFGR